MMQRGDYALLNPLGAKQPWQGDSFVDALCKCGKTVAGMKAVLSIDHIITTT
jgi:hypothetical protein